MPTTITNSGTPASPRQVACADSRRAYYWRDGTSVKGKILDRQGNTLAATFTVTLSGGALTVDSGTSIDAWEFVDGQGKHYFALQVYSGGSLIEVTSRDGLDFS